LHVERLQDLDELVNDQVALLPNEVNRVVLVGEIDRRAICDELIRREVLAQAKVDPQGVERAPNLLMVAPDNAAASFGA